MIEVSPWVTLTMVATTIVLAVTVFVLHLNEKVRPGFVLGCEY